MNTKTHFPFRIDVWDDRGDSIIRHLLRDCGRDRLGNLLSMAEGEDELFAKALASS